MSDAIDKGKLKDSRKFPPDNEKKVVTEPAMIRKADGASNGSQRPKYSR